MLHQAAERRGFQFGAGLLVEFGAVMATSSCVHPRLATGGRVPRTTWRGRRRTAILPPARNDRKGSEPDGLGRCTGAPCPPSLFDAAVAAADPRTVLAAHLPDKPGGRCIVVGGGKSAAVMAAALEDAWPDVALEGTVVTRYGHAVPTRRIEVIEASHPVPDANSERGARRLLERVRGLRAGRPGGGADVRWRLRLAGRPGAGLTLADKQAVNRALLACGANITEMNCVRKHLSAIKGGRLAAAAAPARVVTLAISDVPGDDPAVIGSGPTVPDPTTFADARAILTRYRHRAVPGGGRAAGPGGRRNAEARQPAERRIPPDRHADDGAAPRGRAPRATLAWPRSSWATRWKAKRARWALVMAGIARSVRAHGEPAAAPAVLLSGGETTVTIGRGPAGHGGRNTEFLLGLAVALAGAPGIWAVAGDTDGIDGMDEVAGALLAPDTLARVRAKGLDPRAHADGTRQPQPVRRGRRPDPHRPDPDQCQRFPRDPDRLRERGSKRNELPSPCGRGWGRGAHR